MLRQRSATRFAAATSRPCRVTCPTRWSTPTRPRARWTRSGSGSTRWPSAATGSGACPRPTSSRRSRSPPTSAGSSRNSRRTARAPSSGRRRQAAADELDDARDPAVDAGEAALLERLDDLLALEDPHAARALEHRLQRLEGELAANRRHQRDPPARAKHPAQLVERGERLGEEMQGGE